MLKAHANAPDQTLTLGELAKAANYESYSAAILHYGTLAKKIIDFCNLAHRQEEHWNDPVYTCAIGDFVEGEFDSADWAWRMHDEVVDALKSLNMA